MSAEDRQAANTEAVGGSAAETGSNDTSWEQTGATGDIQLDNGVFRVTRWTIEPGGVIPMHTHEHEYVVVPMVTDTMHVRNADGSELTAELEAGVSYTRPAGSEHEVSNLDGEDTVIFVEVERL